MCTYNESSGLMMKTRRIDLIRKMSAVELAEMIHNLVVNMNADVTFYGLIRWLQEDAYYV